MIVDASQVETAARNGRVLVIPAGSIVTPAARDRARELKVEIQTTGPAVETAPRGPWPNVRRRGRVDPMESITEPNRDRNGAAARAPDLSTEADRLDARASNAPRFDGRSGPSTSPVVTIGARTPGRAEPEPRATASGPAPAGRGSDEWYAEQSRARQQAGPAPGATDRADLSEPLVAFAIETATSQVPDAVIEYAAVLLLDAITCGFAGIRGDGVAGLIGTLAKPGGRGGSRLIGQSGRLPAPDAALANGTLIHSFEFDSSYDAGLFHPMAGIVPAALAVAEEVGRVSGRDLLAALAVAAEVACRIGFGAPGIPPVYRCGAMAAFGAVIAAVRLRQLSEATTRNALGIALAQGAPPWQPHEEGSSCHGPLPGFGARAGLLAVDLAQAGLTGPWRVLEGNSGYYRTYEGGRWDRDRALAGIGNDWNFLDIGIKPYPSGRLTHGAITGILTLREQHGLRPEEIESVVVESGAVVAARTGRVPASDASVTHQRLSVPFTVAQAIIHGRVGLTEFGAGRAADPLVQRLVQRVDVRPAADIPETAICPVRLTVTTDGHRLRHEETALLGNPDWPLSREQRLAKLEACLRFGGQPGWRRAELIVALVEQLPHARQIDPLLSAIGR